MIIAHSDFLDHGFKLNKCSSPQTKHARSILNANTACRMLIIAATIAFSINYRLNAVAEDAKQGPIERDLSVYMDLQLRNQLLDPNVYKLLLDQDRKRKERSAREEGRKRLEQQEKRAEEAASRSTNPFKIVFETFCAIIFSEELARTSPEKCMMMLYQYCGNPLAADCVKRLLAERGYAH